MSRLRIFYIIAFAWLVANYANAQSLQQIKQDQNYVWGEGTGTTTEEAEKAALAQMSRSITVTVYDKSVDADINGSSFQQGILQAVSSTKLQNVQIRVLSEEPNAKVFCFMQRDEVKKMMKQKETRILDLVETGKKAEERLQIDDALRCYYWALLLSRTGADPKVSFGNQTGMATVLLPTKIKSVIQLLKAEVLGGDVESHGFKAIIKFTYNGKDVSSLQFNYNDGQSVVGPVVARDGIGEADMVAFPGNDNLHLTYETKFRKEVDPLDTELSSLYGSGSLPSFNSQVDIPVKIKGNTVKTVKPKTEMPSTATIAAEPTKDKKTIQMKPVSQPDELMAAVSEVETAISSHNPEMAYKRFTPEGYKLFATLLNGSGSVSLVGKSNYQFIQADGYLIGRATRIKIRYRDGRTFNENLVYRFNPESKKIESIAFALTKVAENDIMNAAASWPEISRWAILNFMEDYQTAYALKRLDYIKSIFSDDAIIITGTVLKKAETPDRMFDANKIVDFMPQSKNVKYSHMSKDEYIKRLGMIFKERDYVNLTFENNVTKIIDLPSVVEHGAAFGIEIRQRYVSSGYSDDGYLTLAFDTRGEHPIIHVRLWQPDKTEMVSLQEFISKFSN